MPFPDSPRVIYAQNPLIEVICQLRFPSILLIDSEPPAKFQERIRKAYPLYKENQLADMKLELPPEIVKLSGGAFPASLRTSRVSYDFVSADQIWKVGLTRDFLSLSTTRYERWEDFKAHLLEPLSALIEVYSPSFFSRIGLRYRDLIDRGRLGLKDVPWSRLLKEHIAGELASPEVFRRVVHTGHVSKIRLDDDEGEVLLQHGLPEESEDQLLYLIDSDFSFNGRTEVNDAIAKLDTFNRKSGRLFRWCITQELHDSMEPRSL
jgi:uncharacterized protein (TIGR04255 family)